MQLQPVLCGSALHGAGVQPVLDAVQYYLPSPLDVPPVEGESVGEKQKKTLQRRTDPEEPFSGLVFKVLPAKTGDIHWVRVYSGVLKSNSRVFFFQAEDGIRVLTVTGVQTCALPICWRSTRPYSWRCRYCCTRFGPSSRRASTSERNASRCRCWCPRWCCSIPAWYSRTSS